MPPYLAHPAHFVTVHAMSIPTTTPAPTPAAITTTDYWCPTDRAWSYCPGPCPDGSAHAPSRTRTRPSYLIDETSARSRGLIPPGVTLPPGTQIRSTLPQ
jgi:hypothetical protein